MGFKKTVAGTASGAALGYIVGNIPGAVFGGTAGYKVSQMAVTRNQRRRSSVNLTPLMSPYPTPSRRGSRSSSRSSSRRSSMQSVQGSARQVTGSGQPRPNAPIQRVKAEMDNRGMKMRSRKRLKTNGRKKVRVSRTMYRAVKQVIEAENVKGRLKRTIVSPLWYGGTAEVGGGTISNKQKVQYLKQQQSFQLQEFQDAVAVLFGNKPLAEVPNGSSVFIDHRNLKVHIHNSYLKLLYKNNSQRQYTIKVLIVAPRRKDNSNEPKLDWSLQLSNNAPTATFDPNDTSVAKNLNTMNYETFGAMPTRLDGWNANWKCEIQTLVLQPGQEQTVFVQGPKNVTLDMEKQYQGTVAQANWMHTRWVMNIFYADLLATNLGAIGRYAESGQPVNGNFDGNGVLVEQQYHYKIGMPEQTGFQYIGTTAGTVQGLGKRRNCYAEGVFFDAQSTGSLTRVDDGAAEMPYNPSA